MEKTEGTPPMEATAPNLGHDEQTQPIPDNLVHEMDRDELSRLVREVNDDGRGTSYQEMADRAEAAGHPLSKAYFQKLATNAVASPPTADRLRGVAAALKKPLAVVQRAAAIQFMDYQATELAGYDEDVRVIVAHLAGMGRSDRRRWLAMMEADERARRQED